VNARLDGGWLFPNRMPIRLRALGTPTSKRAEIKELKVEAFQ
jgi:hypothetical protein